MTSKPIPNLQEPELPAHLVAQSTYRRDGLAVFGPLNARRTALLVLNMQNAWMAPDAPFRLSPLREPRDVLARIHRFAARLRDGGGQVAWIRTTVGAVGTPAYWSTYYDHFIEPTKRAIAIKALTPGNPLHALYPEVQVESQDWVLDKSRFNAFAFNAHDLDGMLRQANIDTVVVAGTATNVCCETTIRDAMSRDYRTFMPHNLVDAPTVDAHHAGLRSVMQAFADVRSDFDLTFQ